MTDQLAGGDAGTTAKVGQEESLEKRLARAEERLGFYNSFDQVIQENISRAGQLMREALELRERTQQELEETQSNIVRQVSAERARFQSELSYLHEELVRLQDTAASMARRVSSALGDLSVAEFFGTTLAPPSIEPGQSEAAVENGVVDSLGEAAEREVGTDRFVSHASVGTSELSLGEPAVEPGPDTVAELEAAVPSYPTFEASDGETEDQVLAAEPAVGAFVGEAEEAEAAEAEQAAEAEAIEGAPEAEEPTEAAADEAAEIAAEVEPESEPEAKTTSEAAEGAVEDAVAAEAETASVVETAEDAVQEDTGAVELDEVAAAAEEAEAEPAPEAANGGAADAGFLDSAVAAPEPAELALDAMEPRSVMVLVHGVPRAAAALSLQRHLHGLEYVDSVEAREYAEGILRLQVTANRELALDDLRSWDGGEELVPVTVKADVIEVRLPGAQGF